MHIHKFTHLHVHTQFSLLDGSSKIKELILRTKELGMDSIAITDHGVMFGVIDFYKIAKENGIKPILGCEVYVSSGSRHNKTSENGNFYYHLVLLAENNVGYNNLMKLVSKGYTEGFYYKPRIDFELLSEFKEGLIALSACLGGVIPKKLTNSSYDKAKEEALKYSNLLGKNNFYLELQNHGINEQKIVNEQLIRISKETGIPLVATNDLHYVYEEDVSAHDILLCIKTVTNINDERRMQYPGGQFFLKSPEQMYNLFYDVQEALDNTTIIAERCNVDIKFNEYRLPKYHLDNITSEEYLNLLCQKGLQKRYKIVTNELEARMNYELDLIKKMGFIDYFLIVWDFIKYAKENKIAVGPGRGSAAGSIVAYCLNITNIDPIKYNLIFERFLNPERVSMPDIDIDFCYERRQEVIDYVVNKYGNDRVAQIITFGTMAAKGSIRDCGRALDMPYADVDKIAKMIPFELGITIKRALVLNQELNELYLNNYQVKNLLDTAMKLEGITRHVSTHAAGVIISDLPISEYVPLYKSNGVITTQFTMNTLEELGLLKMDFLGLRNLTVIQNSVEEINRNYNISIDIDKINFEDKDVYSMISKGKTEGVFQLESSGMKSFMKELKPDNLEDIIAGVSLFRPGPMDFIPRYISGKNNKETILYTHERLKPILKETYGCIVYQEQVMQIVQDLAGYSLGRADMLRRVMSKKKISEMDKERKNFIYGIKGEILGCVNNGILEKDAEKIFDEMVDFARYAFNKSHAAAYAVIGYQTAWLKFHYQVEFMAALMTSVMDNKNKITEYMAECLKMNISLLPPDINKGYGRFTVSDNSIRFGFLAIKNVGKNFIESLIKEREANGEFSSLTNFINRIDSKDLNKRCIESLIKSGSLSSIGGTRSQHIESYKNIIDSVGKNKKNNIDGQMNLFSLSEDSSSNHEDENLPTIKEYNIKDILNFEKEVLGVYISGHPLQEYKLFLEKYVKNYTYEFIYDNDEQILDLQDNQEVTIGGIVLNKTIKYTKNNQAMAFLLIEDFYGTIEVILFSNIYSKYSECINENDIVIIKGSSVIKDDEEPKIIGNKIISYKQNELLEKRKLWIKIPINNSVNLEELKSIISLYKGNVPVIFYYEQTKQRVLLDEKYWISLDDAFLNHINKLVLNEHIVIK